MRHLYTFLLLITSFIPVQVFSQGANKGTFESIKFIEGHWKATQPDGRKIEAVWVGQSGDNMVGFMRMMTGEKADLYEILTYEQTDEGLVSFVKHFKPRLIGQEAIDNPNKYIFVEASKDRAIFKNPNDDMRVLYEKRSADQFAIAPGNLVDGKWVFKDLFVFNRVK